MSLTLTILTDDTSERPGVSPEHGLAVHIQTRGASVLLDTGQSGDTLRRNARALGVDLSAVSALILSHGHYDHTGGVPAFLETNSRAHLYLHPAALSPRFRRLPNPPHKSVGMPEGKSLVVQSLKGRVTWTTGPTQVAPEICATGPIPRTDASESATAGFYFDPPCTMPDPIVDDQAVWIATREGPVVVVGCAHAGILNTLDHVRRQSGSRVIRAVVGGLHLLAADEARLSRVCAALAGDGVGLVAPCHCTGSQAMTLLAQRLGERCKPCHAGDRLTFSTN